MVRNEFRHCRETKFFPSSATEPQNDGTDVAQHLWAKVSSFWMWKVSLYWWCTQPLRLLKSSLFMCTFSEWLHWISRGCSFVDHQGYRLWFINSHVLAYYLYWTSISDVLLDLQRVFSLWVVIVSWKTREDTFNRAGGLTSIVQQDRPLESISCLL